MKVIYIAGPIRAANGWLIERNNVAAETLALEVWRLGAVAICPHSMGRFMQNALPDDIWLAGDLELVRRSDAVLMVPGWERSIGATGEAYFARQLAIPVFETLDEVRAFIETPTVVA